MKFGFKLLTITGALFAAGTIAATPMVVSASDGDSDVAVFVGNTCGLNPDVQLVGGTGTFCFSSTDNAPVPGVCEGVSTDTTPAEIGACTITASGNYSNTVCGTGSASGSASIVELADNQADTETFSITFASGLGVVTGGATGVVQLLPTSPATPPACVSGFTVVGVDTTN